MERELQEALGTKVHLLTEKWISPYLIDIVRREMEVIYGWGRTTPYSLLLLHSCEERCGDISTRKL